MKLWKGYWIMTTAIIHTLYALVYFKEDWVLLFQNGFINAISTTRLALAVWFFLFGQLLLMLGQAVMQIEKQQQTITKALSYNLALMTIFGVVVMPISGIWLMFPPVIGLLLKSHQSCITAAP